MKRKGGREVYELVVLESFESEDLLDLLGRVRVIEVIVDDEDGSLNVSHLEMRCVERRRGSQRRDEEKG